MGTDRRPDRDAETIRMAREPGAAPRPPQGPYPPRPPRRGEPWSPGAFSPAIFLVAVAVIGILVAAALLGRRGGAAPTATVAAPAATSATGQPAARAFVVANTGGEGVFLRRSPRLADRDTAYADGTRLVAVGEDVTGEGQRWHHVRAPDGRVGYIPVVYTAEVP